MPLGLLTWIGLAVGIAGVTLLGWSMIGDRGRGRRRCWSWRDPSCPTGGGAKSTSGSATTG